jgi:hypothetical protein
MMAPTLALELEGGGAGLADLLWEMADVGLMMAVSGSIAVLGSTTVPGSFGLTSMAVEPGMSTIAVVEEGTDCSCD